MSPIQALAPHQAYLNLAASLIENFKDLPTEFSTHEDSLNGIIALEDTKPFLCKEELDQKVRLFIEAAKTHKKALSFFYLIEQSLQGATLIATNADPEEELLLEDPFGYWQTCVSIYGQEEMLEAKRNLQGNFDRLTNSDWPESKRRFYQFNKIFSDAKKDLTELVYRAKEAPRSFLQKLQIFFIPKSAYLEEKIKELRSAR